MLAVACAASGLRADEYSHRRWRTDDGLPQNRIQAITQTSDGYLWIGTFEGLARFDGVRFVVFDRSNTPAFSDNSILWVEPARDGSLWIGTEGGGLLHYAHGEFHAFGRKDGLTNNFGRALDLARDGTFWVGTDREFFRHSGNVFFRLDNALHKDGAGVLWAGRRRTGPDWRQGRRRLPGTRDPAGNTVSVIFEDRQHDIWVGLQDGLMRFSRTAFSTVSSRDGLRDDDVLTICEEPERVLWLLRYILPQLQAGRILWTRARFRCRRQMQYGCSGGSGMNGNCTFLRGTQTNVIPVRSAAPQRV